MIYYSHYRAAWQDKGSVRKLQIMAEELTDPFIFGLRHAKMCLRAYADSQGLSACALRASDQDLPYPLTESYSLRKHANSNI